MAEKLQQQHPGSPAAPAPTPEPGKLLQLAVSMAGRLVTKAGGKLESFEALLVHLDLLLAAGRCATAGRLAAQQRCHAV